MTQAKDELFVQESCGGYVPNKSIMFVSQGLFALAGQLFASSICQGGPAPSFLTTWVYQYMVHGSEAIPLLNESSLDGSDSKYTELFKKVLTFPCGFIGVSLCL
jgi:hypothetical protein